MKEYNTTDNIFVSVSLHFLLIIPANHSQEILILKAFTSVANYAVHDLIEISEYKVTQSQNLGSLIDPNT